MLDSHPGIVFVENGQKWHYVSDSRAHVSAAGVSHTTRVVFPHTHALSYHIKCVQTCRMQDQLDHNHPCQTHFTRLRVWFYFLLGVLYPESRLQRNASASSPRVPVPALPWWPRLGLPPCLLRALDHLYLISGLGEAWIGVGVLADALCQAEGAPSLFSLLSFPVEFCQITPSVD